MVDVVNVNLQTYHVSFILLAQLWHKWSLLRANEVWCNRWCKSQSNGLIIEEKKVLNFPKSRWNVDFSILSLVSKLRKFWTASKIIQQGRVEMTYLKKKKRSNIQSLIKLIYKMFLTLTQYWHKNSKTRRNKKSWKISILHTRNFVIPLGDFLIYVIKNTDNCSSGIFHR